MGTVERHGTVDILLVEDNPGDVRLFTVALAAASIKTTLHVAPDGEAALDFLAQAGQHADAPRPHIVVLDLNLPKKSGAEVLDAIKSSEALRTIPVIILSSSDDPKDVAQSYAHYANCYIRKPMDGSGFMSVVRKNVEFWLSTARLPSA